MKTYQKWTITVISPPRPEKTFCRWPMTPTKCFDDVSKMLPSWIQHAPRPQESRRDAPRSLKDRWKIPTTLPRQPNTPPNYAPHAYKTLQNDTKMPWHRPRIREVNWSDTNEKYSCTAISSLQINESDILPSNELAENLKHSPYQHLYWCPRTPPIKKSSEQLYTMICSVCDMIRTSD